MMLFCLFLLFVCCERVFGNYPGLVWCTVRESEKQKCEQFRLTLNSDPSAMENFMRLSCELRSSYGDCMTMIDEGDADIIVVDPGQVFLGGRYHSLIPIMSEVYTGGLERYFSVAVVKTGDLLDVRELKDLRGTKACFAGVGSLAGWALPIAELMSRRVMEVIDCNNHVKSAMNFFGDSCATNCLTDKFNPLGDNSHQCCALCVGEVGKKCYSQDPYSGFEGAYRCLVEAGDIAFLKHSTVREMTEVHFNTSLGKSSEDFELLCMDGSRRPIGDYLECNWGSVPSHAVMISSAKTIEERRYIQEFLTESVFHFGKRDEFYTTPDPYNGRWAFNMFMSGQQYGYNLNLIFQDDTEALAPIDEPSQNFQSYLGETLEYIREVRRCPIRNVRMCVTSQPEFSKCIKMRTALKAQLLKPEMSCVLAHNSMECMSLIYKGDADVSMMDAGDIYTGGLKYGLIPILAEQYNLDGPEYYVVAVTQQADQDTDILHLREKFTCHTGLGHAAGWIMPMAFLINNGRVRKYGCDGVKAAGLYFQKACVPGAMNGLYNHGSFYSNLCDLCHGASAKFCRRSSDEDFYGYTGAFRCLVEGGGNVAFVKHTTVTENTDGKRREWWIRNQLTEDYELICMDGNRAPIGGFEDCNLGKVKSNALVTRGRGGYNRTEIDAYLNLFMYAQQFYGQRYGGDYSFRLFYSQPPYWDLIFQDATQQLVIVPPEQYHYHKYLGEAFLQAVNTVDCAAGSSAVSAVTILLLLPVVISVI